VEKLLKAIYFATNKLKGQKRRDGRTPFISHLLAAALLLSRVTKDEDIIIAGILHDIVEDTNTSVAGIEKIFGGKVARIVSECTEENKDATWKDRKKAVLGKIPYISSETALVKSADILHNNYDLVKKINEEGITFLQIFHASGKDKLDFEFKRLELLKKYHPNVFLKDIEKNLKMLEKLIA
jgi:guanosine-3',5'-bis(diphosphate) 3'-pyrophosphohydrolase